MLAFYSSLALALTVIVARYVIVWRYPSSQWEMTYSHPGYGKPLAFVEALNTSAPPGLEGLLHYSPAGAPPHYSLHRYIDNGSRSALCDREGSLSVVFIPGTGGSHEQGRSFGSHFARLAAAESGSSTPKPPCIDLFVVGFGEENVFIRGGGSLARQSAFVAGASRHIRSLYPGALGTRLVLLGFSMGGVVARAAALDLVAREGKKSSSKHLAAIVTIASPHLRPPLSLDAATTHWYATLNRAWRAVALGGEEESELTGVRGVPLVSVTLGPRDLIVMEKEGDVRILGVVGGANTTSTTTPPLPPWVWLSTVEGFSVEHKVGVWCSQVLRSIVAGLVAGERVVGEGGEGGGGGGGKISGFNSRGGERGWHWIQAFVNDATHTNSTPALSNTSSTSESVLVALPPLFSGSNNHSANTSSSSSLSPYTTPHTHSHPIITTFATLPLHYGATLVTFSLILLRCALIAACLLPHLPLSDLLSPLTHLPLALAVPYDALFAGAERLGLKPRQFSMTPSLPTLPPPPPTNPLGGVFWSASGTAQIQTLVLLAGVAATLPGMGGSHFIHILPASLVARVGRFLTLFDCVLLYGVAMGVVGALARLIQLASPPMKRCLGGAPSHLVTQWVGRIIPPFITPLRVKGGVLAILWFSWCSGGGGGGGFLPQVLSKALLPAAYLWMLVGLAHRAITLGGAMDTLLALWAVFSAPTWAVRVVSGAWDVAYGGRDVFGESLGYLTTLALLTSAMDALYAATDRPFALVGVVEGGSNASSSNSPSSTTLSNPGLYCNACKNHGNSGSSGSSGSGSGGERPCLAPHFLAGVECTCWDSLPSKVAVALSKAYPKEWKSAGEEGKKGAFEDLCRRSGHWSRCHLRLGQVLMELPPGARIPFPLLPRGGAGCSSGGFEEGLPAGAGAGGSGGGGKKGGVVGVGGGKGSQWTPPLQDILRCLPTSLIRTFLCDTCACPHGPKGGRSQAVGFLGERLRVMEIARGTRELEEDESSGGGEGGGVEGGGGTGTGSGGGSGSSLMTPLPPSGAPLALAWVDWDLTEKEERRGGLGGGGSGEGEGVGGVGGAGAGAGAGGGGGGRPPKRPLKLKPTEWAWRLLAATVLSLLIYADFFTCRGDFNAVGQWVE